MRTYPQNPVGDKANMAESRLNCENIDRLAMFLSATAFRPYWALLAGSAFSKSEQDAVAASARMVVQDFMDQETIYWNVDFSQSRMACTHAQLFHDWAPLGEGVERQLTALALTFCGNAQERKNIDYTLGYLHRVAHDASEEWPELGNEKRDLIATCLDSPHDIIPNLREIEQHWLSAPDAWDRYLRELTPDVPEYLFLDFAEACSEHIALPNFLNNLELFLSPEERRSFLALLTSAIISSFPEDTHLEVPRILRV